MSTLDESLVAHLGFKAFRITERVEPEGVISIKGQPIEITPLRPGVVTFRNGKLAQDRNVRRAYGEATFEITEAFHRIEKDIHSRIFHAVRVAEPHESVKGYLLTDLLTKVSPPEVLSVLGTLGPSVLHNAEGVHMALDFTGSTRCWNVRAHESSEKPDSLFRRVLMAVFPGSKAMVVTAVLVDEAADDSADEVQWRTAAGTPAVADYQEPRWRDDFMIRSRIMTADAIAGEFGWPQDRRAAEYLRKWVSSGRAIRLRYQGDNWYPLFQFGPDNEPLPVIKTLVSLWDDLPDAPWRIAKFLDTPDSALGDRTTWKDGKAVRAVPARRPADLLLSEPDSVVAAAKQALGLSDGF